jgi:hypothetical protein
MNQPLDDDIEDEDETPGSSRPTLLTTLILLFLIIAMLATLAWPVIRQVVRDYVPRPTPTSPFLREA